MKILVTGYPGLLSLDLVPLLQKDYEVVTLSVQELDITQKEAVFSAVEALNPDIIINCAAYTAVDAAETDWAGTFSVNALGAHHLALACQKKETVLLQISTDYVFDGRSRRPYQPWDSTNPISVYGASKLAGEFYIEKLLRRYYILRTSSLYGKHGPNFVRAILNQAEKGGALRVVADQVMSPTWSVNLARGILEIIRSQNFGTFHLTDQTDGGISWFDFAQTILKLKGLDREIQPISSDDLNRPAPRPPYSTLDTHYLTLACGYQSLSYQEALEQFLKDY
ncbi:MAG TPA: dTDP-4-dehydrorhamnose reductase [Thermodesulfobacteriota bacterium]|nr:dTDP-4-dehydrorhamnose reductase [Thermodesulfobacteriota bacterium]